MELSAQAGPGVEKAAEQTVESACHLADLAGPDGWSTVAAEDVLDAIDTLTETLGGADEELAQALAAVTAATAQARRRLGIAVNDQPPGRDGAASVPVARGPERRPPRRRGLGPGFRGIRTDC
jgi:outer membrane receptor protein involved in Fe transport